MLQKLSKKFKTKQDAPLASVKKETTRSKLANVLTIVIWAVLSYIVANNLVLLAFKYLIGTRFLLWGINVNTMTIILGLATFGLMLLFFWIGHRLGQKKKFFKALVWEKGDLAFGGWLTWQQLFLAVASFLAFMFISTILIAVIAKLVPAIDMEQAQEIGFSASTMHGRTELILAFVFLAILTPLVEEILFRGFIYAQLRRQWSLWPSILLTSLLFGIAHGQWNVGIVTFVMSIVMCLCREATKSIYPAILIHIFKNALAFVLLFILKVPQ